ncbi:DNA helicase RecQ [Tissierella sp.]|uniref:DNA helicase RecQ n=1 Tax=Tissierella sp. TaxID=41274 RepID=UPI0028663CB2|nr:DNA helicase RecQ [Tissierella sp.]MDR7856859.1 DNA helicase RecQ [Tissierella sp.]
MDINMALKSYFGYTEFKEGQEKIVKAILDGKDVLGIMPTGGGKSLCYQLPAILLDGITIVVSPLIALMKDQVDSLNEIGISGAFINSTLSDNELNQRLQEIREGKYKIIYVAPERLNAYSFVNLIKDIKVSMIAIDEAHCISQWGHDFRPSYVEIPRFISSIPTRPIVAAYTATATKLIIEEIKELIGLRTPVESIIGFDRPNLFYQVVKVSDKFTYLSEYIKNNFPNDSGIIYCSTRKSVESVAEKLNKHGFSAVGYHGGMDSNTRQKNQDDFILNKLQIIVATNAFGMGIDKPDVRFVIHYNMPQNMEAYYQEAGRAGRDGEPSHCILLYSPSDIVKQKLLIQSNPISMERESILYQNLQYLVDYCHTNDCLRNSILNYFGEDIEMDNCHNCGNCLDKSEMVDITIESQKILSCIYRVEEKYGLTMIIQVLRGSRNKRLLEFGLDNVSTYGIMKEYGENSLREIIMTLVSKGYVYITADKFPVLKLTQTAGDILRGNTKVYHKKHLIEIKTLSKKQGLSTEDLLDSFDEDLFLQLKELRYNLSQERGFAPFMIFHDSTLKEMASYFPQSKEAMLTIKGVGLKKYESYGENFLSLIKDYSNDKGIDSIDIEKEEIIREDLADRYQLTYNAYLEGLSLKEMSEKRNFTISTIIEHLSKSVDKGQVVDWSRFIDDPHKEKEILAAINKVGLEKLKPIKEALPEEYTYEDIRLVIAKNELK